MEVRLVCPHCGSVGITRHWYSPDYHGSHIVYYWRCEKCEKEFETPVSSEEFPEARRKVRVKAAAEDMYKALKQIAEREPEKWEEEFSSMRDITVDCNGCYDMIELARETLKRAGLLEE